MFMKNQITTINRFPFLLHPVSMGIRCESYFYLLLGVAKSGLFQSRVSNAQLLTTARGEGAAHRPGRLWQLDR